MSSSPFSARAAGPAAGPAPVAPTTAPLPVGALPVRRQPEAPSAQRSGLSADPAWYKTAVF